VELRAQSGENSQLFMESQFTNANGMPAMGRFNTMDGFGASEFDQERAKGAAITQQTQKVTINLEDAELEE